ncbi:Serine/threonine-protein kinase [Pleurotus pulmonarius]
MLRSLGSIVKCIVLRNVARCGECLHSCAPETTPHPIHIKLFATKNVMPSIHRAPVSPKVLASLDLGFFKPLIAWTFEPISKPIEPVLGGWDEIDGLPEHLTAFFQADPNPFNSRFGSGSSAAVCKGYIDFNGMTYVVAAKERYFGGESSQDVMLEEFAGKISREVKVLRRLKHPNIVNYLGVALGVPRHGHNQLSIITSVCDRGGLPSYVSHAPNCQRLSLALDIAHALEYLHENNIVHGQLKPRNISITNSGAGVKAVLCDFSCARIIGDDGFVPWSSKDGSYRYTPQEIARPSDSNPVYVSKEGDIYAFAFVALFILSGKEALECDGRINVWDVSYRLLNGERPLRKDHEGSDLTDVVWSLLESCWSPEATKRPSAASVVSTLTSLPTVRGV